MLAPELIVFRRYFAKQKTRRGLFATVYRLITNRAVESVEEDYEHEEWAKNLITEFARRYLANLHGHLPSEGEGYAGQWQKILYDCPALRRWTWACAGGGYCGASDGRSA